MTEGRFHFMLYSMDLHIHSALSPCADDDMTPNNIVNMSVLKGLDIIAVTDHNSSGNCEAVMKCACSKGILVLPGMELETREEVHLLCLFPDQEQAKHFQDMVYSALPEMENKEHVFGRQIVFDEYDMAAGTEKRLLLAAANLSLEEAVRIVREMGGVAIPAHIDRGSYSIISNLGAVPEDLNFKYLELSRRCDVNEFKTKAPYLKNSKFIKNSDAHRLGDILERESFIDLEMYDTRCLIETLRSF